MLNCILIAFFVCSVSAVERPAVVMPLWEGIAPLETGDMEPVPNDVRLTIHRADHPNGAALVICPGGGYSFRASKPEGHGIAEWLNAHGIMGAVLDYRLPHGRSAVPLLDAQHAIRLVRAHAAAWGIDPARVGIIGFSAGGHLAASAATLFEQGSTSTVDPLAAWSCRPDFAILIYPVISMQAGITHPGSCKNLLGAKPPAALTEHFSTERQVSARTPPVFLAHAQDDTLVTIENSRLFAAAMRAAMRPVQLLELAQGGHGFNGYKGPSWDAWQNASLQWLASCGFMPPESAMEKLR